MLDRHPLLPDPRGSEVLRTMTLKSIERYLDRYTIPNDYPWIGEMLDEIEAEIAERYMDLPVDAEGKPCKLGDFMEYVDSKGSREVFIVSAYNSELPDGRGRVMLNSDDGADWYAEECRHVESRTLEDVLLEVARHERTVAEASIEIRELLGVKE